MCLRVYLLSAMMDCPCGVNLLGLKIWSEVPKSLQTFWDETLWSDQSIDGVDVHCRIRIWRRYVFHLTLRSTFDIQEISIYILSLLFKTPYYYVPFPSPVIMNPGIKKSSTLNQLGTRKGSVLHDISPYTGPALSSMNQRKLAGLAIL